MIADSDMLISAVGCVEPPSQLALSRIASNHKSISTHSFLKNEKWIVFSTSGWGLSGFRGVTVLGAKQLDTPLRSSVRHPVHPLL